MSKLPLDGLRVLDLTSVLVGPVATKWFGDYGANVIKLEEPQGDLMRALGGASKSGYFSPKFINLNRNKRSLSIDLKRPEARGIVENLFEKADVVITNMRPKALKRLGIDYDTAARHSPNIIYCNIVGFDQRGRYRDKPAYDTIIQGASGIAAAHARVDGEPKFVPMTVADHIVGLITVQTVLLALLHRDRTGKGQRIEVPMFENMAAFVLSEHMGQQVFCDSKGPTGDLRILNALTRPVRTKDGYICVSANTDKQAFALFDAIGHAELKHDPRFSSVKARLKNVDAYHRLRGEALATRTTMEWMAEFDRLDVPAMPYHTFESLLVDPHLADVGFFTEIEHPVEGRIRNMRSPNRFSADWNAPARPAPAIGAESREILRELGYSPSEIDAFVATNLVFDGARRE